MSFRAAFAILFLSFALTVGCKKPDAPVQVGEQKQDKKPEDKKPDPPAKNVEVADIKDKDVLELPYILWGGDVATFLANGGLETKPGTIFDKSGLHFKMYRERRL